MTFTKAPERLNFRQQRIKLSKVGNIVVIDKGFYCTLFVFAEVFSRMLVNCENNFNT